jgi:formylglycine-generating enzyme required for sulfatase activity
MPQIFISYRRADTSKDAGRIYDRLVDTFGKASVFKNVDNIPLGTDFRDVLKEFIEKSDVMLVLIGAHWLEVDSTTGLRRLDNENDFVRFEIVHALTQPHIKIIPVIISPAKAPTVAELPYALQKLLDLNMAYVRDDPDFHTDMTRLIDNLRSIASYHKTKTIAFRPQPSCLMQLFRMVTILTAVMVIVLGVIAAAFVVSQNWNSDAASQVITEPTVILETEVVPTATEITELVVAVQGVQQNSDWMVYSPYIRNFAGVDMVLVPSGCFMMGDDNGDAWERPAHRYCLNEPYWIDRFEVSVSQFIQLVGQASIEACYAGDDGRRPRECISWREALRFCELRDARLPTEAEWEYAARGPDSWIYPWGNAYDAEVVNDMNNFGEDLYEYTAPVDAFVNGISWVGAYQMSGNVWEWTSSIYDLQRFPYPYTPDDGRENLEDLAALRVMRGGSLANYRLPGRASVRQRFGSRYAYNIVGFRCVRDFIE